MKNQSTLLPKSLLLVASFLFFSKTFAQRDSLLNGVSFNYDYTYFDKQFADDWRLTSLQYSRRANWGTIIGRINYANRFDKSGWQVESEAYPVLSKKLYAYTGFSFSNTVPVFANWRTGTSLYYNFAKGWEAEGGFRYLKFNNNVWIGTAGISKYLGAWLLNARTFFSVDAPLSNQSLFFKTQRYLKNEKDYVWLQVSNGVSPDESRSIQLNTTTKLLSKRVNAGAKLSLSNHVQVTLSAGYARDEYREKTYGNQYNGSAGISYSF